MEGLIGLGYEREDYSKPLGPNEKRDMHTVYPTFRACGPAAAELINALGAGRQLDGEFAAIVVLKSTMLRTADEDEDEEPDEDTEAEFTVKAIMPHVDGGEPEDKIMADFEKLPKAVMDKEESEEEGGEEGEPEE